MAEYMLGDQGLGWRDDSDNMESGYIDEESECVGLMIMLGHREGQSQVLSTEDLSTPFKLHKPAGLANIDGIQQESPTASSLIRFTSKVISSTSYSEKIPG
ncbi:hypothetical protein PGT21_004750 [Puccinia graminis f. sp. tritici]|uniref:Uncharacterized protein n=1 Tax=Puccinia graminis f. sp. tritici TaxID=56615 RepID=A0A5B0M3H2_PUCGR|nr:hypothetical protein PGT21_004750 [Puccinia graminis f. sp. tritici]KAA1123177.1 hypothetical protein PGTUg99_019689 [Puccinia graminis f. sp. tritici]